MPAMHLAMTGSLGTSPAASVQKPHLAAAQLLRNEPEVRPNIGSSVSPSSTSS
jgi:hypothetical protein